MSPMVALPPPSLLHLPNELLLIIVLEAMWACTLPESSRDVPDRRRLTNHPPLEPGKIAVLGGICRRLRNIWQELSKIPSSVGIARNVAPACRTSLVTPNAFSSLNGQYLKGLVLVGQEVRGMRSIGPELRKALLELDLREEIGHTTVPPISDRLASCRSLQTVRIDGRGMAEDALLPLLRGLGQLPHLRHLTLCNFEDRRSPSSPEASYLKTFSTAWSGHLVRLELSLVHNTPLSQFIKIMGSFANTLQIAVYLHHSWVRYTAEAPPVAVDVEVQDMPALWRLSIAFGRAGVDKTLTGKAMLGEVSAIDIMKKAPLLSCFECSERIEVDTQAALDEVGGLVDRGGWKRLRLKLDTWEGDKGARWTEEEKQDVVVG